MTNSFVKYPFKCHRPTLEQIINELVSMNVDAIKVLIKGDRD